MAASTPTRTPLGGVTAASPPRALSSCVELEQALLGELVLLAEEHGARRLTPTTFVTAAAGVRRRLEQHAEQVAELEQLASAMGVARPGGGGTWLQMLCAVVAQLPQAVGVTAVSYTHLTLPTKA